MNATQKISPFQLTCLLLCGRVYTILTWKPAMSEAGSALVAAVLSPVAQFVVVVAALALLERLKESKGQSWMHRGLHKTLAAAGLLFFLWAALWTAVSCGSFISTSFYQGELRLWFVALLLGAGCFAAFQGLEGVARTAPLVLLLAGGGLVLLGVAAFDGMQLRYLPPLTVTPQGTATLSAQGGLMNFELLVLLFLQPYATKQLRKSAIAAWLGLAAALSLAVMLSVMLCLGYYAQGVEYPVLAVARCAQLAVLERLDPVLMGIWVLLGLVKLSVFLFLAAQLWRQLFLQRVWAWRQKGTATLALLVCVATLSGCGNTGDDIGAHTIVTMLEVERGTSCTVRAEYRIVGSGGDSQPNYGVYSGDGDTLAAALAALERKESVRLFTESCRVVALRGDAQGVATVLEELNNYAGIRPLTGVFLSQGALLSIDKDKTVSMGQGLEKLFCKNGGLLEEDYTLKDSIACLRDDRLTLTLPVVVPNGRGDGVYFVELKESKKG